MVQVAAEAPGADRYQPGTIRDRRHQRGRDKQGGGDRHPEESRFPDFGYRDPREGERPGQGADRPSPEPVERNGRRTAVAKRGKTVYLASPGAGTHGEREPVLAPLRAGIARHETVLRLCRAAGTTDQTAGDLAGGRAGGVVAPGALYPLFTLLPAQQ